MKQFIPALALAFSAMALSANAAETCHPDHGVLLAIVLLTGPLYLPQMRK